MHNSDKKDYYAVMGVKPDASAHDIKMAYRRLARKYHPDLNKADDAEKNFKELGEAYEVLREPEKRKLYDQMRVQPQPSQGHSHAGSEHASAWYDWGSEAPSSGEFDADLFASIFGGRHHHQHPPRGGADLHGNITISLQEAYSGADKDMVLPAADKPNGSQKLRVKIPAGVKPEQQIRLAGLGEPGRQGASNGDLYLTVVIKRDPVFDLKGNDVYMTLPIAPWEAALGATVKVPTLAGTVDLKIPPHSQAGQTLRLKKRGFSAPEPGDQLVLLKIVIPQPTTQAATDLYKTMEKELAFNPRQHLEAYHG